MTTMLTWANRQDLQLLGDVMREGKNVHTGFELCWFFSFGTGTVHVLGEYCEIIDTWRVRLNGLTVREGLTEGGGMHAATRYSRAAASMWLEEQAQALLAAVPRSGKDQDQDQECPYCDGCGKLEPSTLMHLAPPHPTCPHCLGTGVKP